MTLVIIGAGLVGLTLTRNLLLKQPQTKICIIETEYDVAYVPKQCTMMDPWNSISIYWRQRT